MCDVLTKALEETAEHPRIVDALRQHLVIVAFGVEEHAVPTCSINLKVLALSSWDKVPDLVASLGLRGDIIL